MISAPIGRHEAFVLQTAREMDQRSDYIVPYLFGKPRLKKPPLSYWATLAVQKVSGSPTLQPWHARLVSVIAGLVMVLATYLMVQPVLGAQTALLSSAMLASSFGLIRQMHKASPDMLYAALCALGLLAFVRAYRATQDRRHSLAGLMMWVAFALAILTKGPQAPGMFLLAFAWYLRRTSVPPRAWLTILRPLLGIPLLALICVPWWWLLNARIGADTLHHSQLGGSLLHLSPLAVLKLFYVYTTPLLLLPWIALLPGAVMWAWRRRSAPGDAAGLFGLVSVVSIVLFSLGSQQKDHYLAPVLPALTTVLAAYATAHLPAWRKGSHLWLALHLGLFLLVLAAAPAWAPDSWSERMPHWTVCMVLSLVLGSIALWQAMRPDALRAPGPLVLSGSVFALLMSVLVQTRIYVGERADAEQGLAQQMANLDGLQRLPLASFKIAPVMLGFYLNRPVQNLGNADRLAHYAATLSSEGGLLIAREERLKALPPNVTTDVLAQSGNPGKTLTLVRIYPRGMPGANP